MKNSTGQSHQDQRLQCVCVGVCFRASSVIADWFQTGGFWKGNTPCPAFAVVLLLHSPYPFNWWMSPKRLTNTTCKVRREEKTKEDRRKGNKTKKRGLDSAQHNVVKTVRPATSLLLCSTLFYSLCDTQLSVHLLFLIPTEDPSLRPQTVSKQPLL